MGQEDLIDLATWRQNLICRISTMGIEEARNAIEAVKDIDRILN
jgi:hypothetical protein